MAIVDWVCDGRCECCVDTSECYELKGGSGDGKDAECQGKGMESEGYEQAGHEEDNWECGECRGEDV